MRIEDTLFSQSELADVNINGHSGGPRISRTFRVIDTVWTTNFGEHAATPELAKLAPGENLERTNSSPEGADPSRFAIEQTDWIEKDGKLEVVRRVIIDIEDPANPWKVTEINH